MSIGPEPNEARVDPPPEPEPEPPAEQAEPEAARDEEVTEP